VKFLVCWTTKLYFTDSERFEHHYPSHLITKSIPEPLVWQNERVFFYSQWDIARHRRPYTTLYNFQYYKKLINLNTKCGLKSQTRSSLSQAFTMIYSHFYGFDSELSAEYPNYRVFFEFSQTFADGFYQPDFFLRYIHSQVELIFLIKKTHPSKKKKNIKTSPKLTIVYISKKRRAALTLRLINTYINSFDLRRKSERYRSALMYLSFSGTNSFLRKQKLLMYTKLLERKKFY
jgi:hypothetical protein